MDVLDSPELIAEEDRKSRTIEEVLRDGYRFNFGDYLSKMFRLFGKTWGNLLGHSGIMMATYIVLYIISALFMVGIMADMMAGISSTNQPDPMILMSKMMTFIIWYIGFIMLYIWLWVMPFRAGIYTHLDDAAQTGRFNFNTFFMALKKKWLKLAILNFLIFLISWALGFVTYLLWFGQLMDNMPSMLENPEAFKKNPLEMYQGMSWVFLAYVPGIFFAVSCSLATPLLLFQTDSVAHALVSSMKIVTRKWFFFFALYLVVYLLSMLGIIACGIGLLLTMQFFPIVIYVIYEDIFIRQSSLSDQPTFV